MSLPAVILIAHDKPRHLHRLVEALDPLPIFLHIDASIDAELHRRMVTGLPDRVVLLERLAAGWARREVLDAELLGYREALTHTDAEHLIVMTGACYPLVGIPFLVDQLAEHPGSTSAEAEPLPYDEWGVLRGWDRFIFWRQWPYRRHRIVVPLPRVTPHGLRPAGGAQTKIICRDDAQHVLRVLDSHPDLARYFRRCWTPDEVTVHSLLRSTRLGASSGPLQHHPWHIDWGDGGVPNPKRLTEADFHLIVRAAHRHQPAAWFARKFDDESGPLLDRIDAELRSS